MWRMTVDSRNSRVQWNSKIFTDREKLQEYLDYFNITDYKGPGVYEDALTCNNYNTIRIDYTDENGVCNNGSRY